MIHQRFAIALSLLLLGLGHVAAIPARAQEQGSDAVHWIHAGRDAMQSGDLAAAEHDFQQAVSVAPTLSDGYLGLGLAQLRRGELDSAVNSLTHATELNPQLPGANLFLGIAQYQIGRGDAAAKSLHAEIALQPADVEALTWLGIVEIGIGHPEEATVPLDQAAALAPKNAQVQYYRGRAHSLVAEQAYHELFKLDPDSALVHRALAETLANSGQPEKAIAEYEAAIKKDPSNPDLYEGLGEQDQKVSRTDAAIAAYQQELKLNANNPIALYNLGMIQVKQGNAASGVPLLRRAEAAHAAAAPTDFYLGLGLADLGQNEEAAHWLELSLANGPSQFIQQSAYYKLVRVYSLLNRKADADRALANLKQLESAKAEDTTGASAQTSASSPDAQHP